MLINWLNYVNSFSIILVSVWTLICYIFLINVYTLWNIISYFISHIENYYYVILLSLKEKEKLAYKNCRLMYDSTGKSLHIETCDFRTSIHHCTNIRIMICFLITEIYFNSNKNYRLISIEYDIPNKLYMKGF